jgi:hypothetical protein
MSWKCRVREVNEICKQFIYFLAEETTWETKNSLKYNIKIVVPKMEFESVIWAQLVQKRPTIGILSTP